MKWGKTVLLFQAIVTLIIGLAFLSQVLVLSAEKITELKIQIENGDLPEGSSPEYIDLKQRYSAATYILLFISLIELIIITKLFI